MSENEEKNNFTDTIKETAQKVWNTTDTTEQYEAEDKEKNKWWAALAYVLAPIPYFAKKDSKYVNYHSTQGMNYFVVAVGFAVISAILQAIIKLQTGTWKLITRITRMYIRDCLPDPFPIPAWSPLRQR